jgi:hypothetical protein
MVGATRLTLMAERLAFVSISARPARTGGGAGRERSEVWWIWIKGDPPLPESILQIQAERIPEGHGTRPQTRPEGLRLCFDPITALRPCAPGAAISDCACRPRQSYRISGENDRLHPSNQFGSITGERHEKAVRSQANVRVKAKSAEERLPRNMLPSRMTARPLRPPGKDRRWMRTCGRLIGFSDRAWGAAAR